MMVKYRNQLAQLTNTFFITDGGMETMLVHKEGIELPEFAAFHILKDEDGCKWMKNFYLAYVNIAQKYNVGLIFESATWRASPDWLRKLGYTDEDVITVNRQAIELLSDIRDQYETEKTPMIIGGSVGPRGDGYNPTVVMTAEEAQVYHAVQIDAISKTNADIVIAFTLTYPEEAIGIARAAKIIGIPVVISFTVENDGRLPTGQTLKEAIELVDKATESTPIYYMINCVHPSVLEHVLNPEESWTSRIHGIKGNASKKSHAELNNSTELDDGNPVEFGQCNRTLLTKLKHLKILGGCCGTDYRHAEETCKACINIINQLHHAEI
jgi:S-methylmethionine-dependent homocysteine/selenocysteine methylase